MARPAATMAAPTKKINGVAGRKRPHRKPPGSVGSYRSSTTIASGTMLRHALSVR
jgi:hypothetical protein